MKRHREILFVALLAMADLLCLNAVGGAVIYMRFYSSLAPRGSTPPVPSLLGFLGLVHLILFPALIVSGAYRLPRRWTVNEALPVVLRALLLSVPLTTVLVFALRLGALRIGLVRTLSRLVVFWTWAGLLVGLTGVRLLAGRLQLALYARGVGLRRALIVGDGMAARQVADRIRRNPWLGERILGRVGDRSGLDWLGHTQDLAVVTRRHRIDVIWLAPPDGPVPELWLPPLLWAPEGSGAIWRALPAHFAHLAAGTPPDLTQPQRELLYRRLEHDIALPTFRVAMIGSRGVPAHYGGVETYVEQVASHLVAGGAQVAVYCHARYVPERGSYHGIELRFAPTIPTKHLETIVHTLLATLHVLLREEEIVHYHALGPATMSWLPRLFGRKVVVTVQGLDWRRAKWGRLAQLYLKFGQWASAHFPNHTIVVSQELADHYRRRYRKQVSHVPNGYAAPVRRVPDQIKRFGLEKNGYILFVGRLVPEKGCHTLLDAYAQLETDKQLVLAGDAHHQDRYREQLERQVRGLSGVKFVGFVRDQMLQELYSNAYLVVHPSTVEGLSISLLEALSYGNCLVVSDIPENLEAIGNAGYVFRAKESDDLARQLQWLLDHPREVEAEQRRALALVSGGMDWYSVTLATRKVYQSLVSGFSEGIGSPGSS